MISVWKSKEVDMKVENPERKLEDKKNPCELGMIKSWLAPQVVVLLSTHSVLPSSMPVIS